MSKESISSAWTACEDIKKIYYTKLYYPYNVVRGLQCQLGTMGDPSFAELTDGERTSFVEKAFEDFRHIRRMRHGEKFAPPEVKRLDADMAQIETTLQSALTAAQDQERRSELMSKETTQRDFVAEPQNTVNSESSTVPATGPVTGGSTGSKVTGKKPSKWTGCFGGKHTKGGK